KERLLQMILTVTVVSVCPVYAQQPPEPPKPDLYKTSQESIARLKQIGESFRMLDKRLDEIRNDLEAYHERREGFGRGPESRDSLLPRIYERRQRGSGMAQLHELARERIRVAREKEELFKEARRLYEETLEGMDKEIADLQSQQPSPEQDHKIEKILQAKRDERLKFEKAVQDIASEVISEATRQRLGPRLWQGERPSFERRDRESPDIARRVEELENRLDLLEDLLLEVAQKVGCATDFPARQRMVPGRMR
ncbi:MAG TPA: hypothetical protein PKH07_16830, partial [bacterium]|nr:hypothetical protein [bacterium]